MSYGFEAGSGWYDLIDVLCHCIQGHTDWKTRDFTQEEKDEFQPVASQVKSKFGGLRFYCDNGDEQTSAMIQMADAMSFKICEECGHPGSRKGTGWIYTLCDDCWKKHKRNQNNVQP